MLILNPKATARLTHLTIDMKPKVYHCLNISACMHNVRIYSNILICRLVSGGRKAALVHRPLLLYPAHFTSIYMLLDSRMWMNPSVDAHIQVMVQGCSKPSTGSCRVPLFQVALTTLTQLSQPVRSDCLQTHYQSQNYCLNWTSLQYQYP